MPSFILPAVTITRSTDTMKKTIPLLAMLAIAIPAGAETPLVSLADYAFDFPTYGYEITITGETRNLRDKLTADDHTTIDDGGYKIKTLIDRMGRKDRQEFMRFFNANCIGFGADAACPITASGEIELSKTMQMIFRVSTATISKGGNEWTNRGEN